MSLHALNDAYNHMYMKQIIKIATRPPANCKATKKLFPMTFKNKTCLSLLKVWSLINVIFSKTSTYLAIPQVRRPLMSESQKEEVFRGRKNSLYI